MEAEGYAIGHCVLGAHSIGAAHIRQRLYWVADYYGERLEGRERTECTDKLTLGENRLVDGMGDTSITTCKRDSGKLHSAEEGINRTRGVDGAGGFGFTDASEIDWIFCRDEKYRPIEPGIFPLVDGVPRGMVHSSDPNATQEARAMRLRGYGNAIVPQVAAEFIRAFYESIL